jgi:translation elongation factor EF-Ts
MIAEDATIQDILDSSYIKDSNLTIAELLKSKIGVLGENIQIKSFKKISL